MQGGMKVILFLDRRPHVYDFIHSDAAKSPFAIPPSGVYLIDDYEHVHEYFQEGNPGPYVAQGYTYFLQHSVPTKEQDLALPSLRETKDRIAAAIKSVQPVRPLLDKVAARRDAPALLKLVDRTSRSEKDCCLRMATVIAASDLSCYGLTYWDFRPFVEQNGVIGWKLLERMAMMLRDARKG